MPLPRSEWWYVAWRGQLFPENAEAGIGRVCKKVILAIPMIS